MPSAVLRCTRFPARIGLAMLAAWVWVAAATSFAMAQTTEVLRGDVAAVDAGVLKLRSSSGQEAAIEEASEVHIFPESARGSGEGHRPMARLPGSTMTNATVASVSPAPSTGSTTDATVASVVNSPKSRTLRLTYAGGEQTVVVPESVPVVTLEPGSVASLAPGQHVIVYAARNADGRLTAERISVGKNGSTPPV